MPLQFRRGTDSDRLTITPVVGEPVFTTDTKKIFVGDGATAGGIEVTGTDSAAVTGLIDSAYIQARQADIFRDSAFITNIVDSAYVQALQVDLQRDSAFINNLISAADTHDSAAIQGQITSTVNATYINNLTIDADTVGGLTTGYLLDYTNHTNTPNVLDSTNVSSIITADVDAAFINALTIDADTLGGNNSAYHLDYNNFTNTPTLPVLGTDFVDSTEVNTLIDTRVNKSFVDALNVDADTLDGQNGTYYLDYNNFTNTPTIPTLGTDFVDSTEARELISVTDAGGDGSLAYNNATGVLTYTGPSAAEVRAHFTAGTGVTIASGEIAIGQAVGTTDSVTFSNVTADNLTINGTTTTVNSIVYTVVDPLLHLADSNEQSDVVDIGFIGHYSPDGGTTREHTGFFRDATNSEFYIFNGLIDTAFDSTLPPNVVNRSGSGFTLANLNVGTLTGNVTGDLTGDVTGTVSDISNHSTTNLSEGTNLYYTTVRADSDITAKVNHSFLAGILDDSTLTIDGDGSTGGVTIADGGITIRTGTGNVAYADFYCETSNAHRTRLKSASHGSYSGNVDVTLPTSTGTLALTTDITTTIDSAYINARTTAGTDSAATIALITATVDSAYVALREADAGGGGGGGSGTVDSAQTISLITNTVDSDYVSARTAFTAALNINKFNYTATGAQTTFTGADVNGTTLSYSPGNVLIHLNGFMLKETVDYTAANGTSIVLNSAADSGNELAITSFSGGKVSAGGINTFSFVADSGQTAFTGADANGTTLDYSAGNTQVFLNGILLDDADYTATNGSSIVLASAADSADYINVASYHMLQSSVWNTTSTNINASAGDKLFVDVSSGTVQVTLPVGPSMGDEVRIIDGEGNAATNNITVARNGSKIQAGDSDFIIDFDRAGLGFVYYNATNGWVLIEN